MQSKLLFIHNTVADYRIPFFNKLANYIDTKFVFTKAELNEQVYGNKIKYDEIKELDYTTLKNRFGICFQLVPFLIKADFECAFIPSMDSFGEFVDAVMAFIILKIRKKKILYFSEKWEPLEENITFNKKLKNKVRLILTKPFIKRVDVVVCSGTKAKEYMEKKIGVEKSKISICYDASETEHVLITQSLRQKYQIADKKIILYYGRIVKRKGLDVLINAVKELQKTDIDTFLVICGNGEYEEQCKEMVNKEGLDNVVFLGKIDTKYRREYFSQVDVFVLPSINDNGTIEAWGLTVNEAMENSVPVISTDAVGAAFDMIVNGQNGYMVKENSVMDLSDALMNTLKDDENLEKMKKEAHNTFTNGFTYSHMAKGFSDVVYNLIKL